MNRAVAIGRGTKAIAERRSNEDGDKCAWNFGSKRQISGPRGAKYNQRISGTHYYLQQEWSNKSSGCVLTGL